MPQVSTERGGIEANSRGKMLLIHREVVYKDRERKDSLLLLLAGARLAALPR